MNPGATPATPPTKAPEAPTGKTVSEATRASGVSSPLKNENSLISLQSVAVDLGGRPVLREVNLDIMPGGYYALLGPNGAGKTTLLRTMLGVLPVKAGRVRIAGKDPRTQIKTIGYVPQRHEFAWDFPISVEGVVMSGRTRHIGWLRSPGRVDYEAVVSALERVEMAHLARRTVGELSGGQRQRVLIARALATNPRALLLDEPFTGVDLPTQELLLELIDGLVAEGTAVVMTTHDIASALVTAQRIVLVAGTIIAHGVPRDLGEESLWSRAFGVSAGSPLLSSVRAILGGTSAQGQGAGETAGKIGK